MFLRPGDVIDDKYEVVSVLGAGGFGSVYSAKQIQFDRLVAVKLLTRVVDPADERARFEQEAKAMNALHHKNIVSFYGFGFSHGAPYMVTELAHGKNLAAILSNEEKLERDRCVALVQQILSALSSAHKVGIIHRDLKPANIILARDADGNEVVKVIDFGLAKLLPGFGIPSQKLTETGFALGTAQYMSPEQCVGGRVDGRADIYAAGCILYQCLTGRLPFDASEALDVMYAHVNTDAPPLAKYLPSDEMTQGLQSFCDNCLAKEPESRYADADEASADLDAIATGKSGKVKTLAPSFSRGQKTLKSAKRKSRKPWLFGLCGLATLSAAFCVCEFNVKQNENVEPQPVVQKNDRAHEKSMVTQVYDAVGVENELKLAAAKHDELVQQLDHDADNHNLSGYQRSRIAYLLALLANSKRQWSVAEGYARLAWNDRKEATTYPPRARNLLIRSLVFEGKFAEADGLMRDLMRSQDTGALPVLAYTCFDYVSVNRFDRMKGLLMSLLALPNLPPLAKQYCYSLLGDASICQARPKEADIVYADGSKIVDPDSLLPNPCWVGAAICAYHADDVAKAHTCVSKFSDAMLTETVGGIFPKYSAWSAMLADAAYQKDRANVEEYAQRVLSLPASELISTTDFMLTMSDQAVMRALKLSGFRDIARQLQPLYTQHWNSAEKHSAAPRLNQVDS